jgi:hypothetical protein
MLIKRARGMYMRSWTVCLVVGLFVSLFCFAGTVTSQTAPETKAEPKKEMPVNGKLERTEEKCPPPAAQKLKEQKSEVEQSRKGLEETRKKLQQDQRDLDRDIRNQRVDQQIVTLQQQIQRLEAQILSLEQRKLGLTQRMLQLQQQKLR